MSPVRWYLSLLGLAAAPGVVAAGACSGDNPPVSCGAGMELFGGKCVPVTPDAGPDSGRVDAGSDAAPQDVDFHFGGVTSVSPASKTPATDGKLSLFVTWDAAQDPFTLPEKMLYGIYVATTPQGERYDAPAYLSIQGVTSFTIQGLEQGKTYYVVVRATNQHGVEDQNTHELSVMAEADTTAPTLGGAPTVVPRLACQSRVSWPAASDTQTAAAGIRYSVYLADTLPVNLSAGAVATTLGVTTIDIAVPGATSPYHAFAVVAEDAAGNASSPSNVGGPDVKALSFEGSVQPILTNDCAPSCHTVNTTNKLGPVYDDGYAYQDILGPPGMPVFANVCKPANPFCGPSTASCADWLAAADAGAPIQGQLIVPGQPQCSVFYEVAFQDKMPPKSTGLPPLSACDKLLIHDWIQAGAKP